MYLLQRNEPLMKSLLSRSNATLSRRSNSNGRSYLLSTYSKPLMLSTTMDATSTAIDFFKGNVEEGMVDSPLNWGLVKMPIYSPSPLK